VGETHQVLTVKEDRWVSPTLLGSALRRPAGNNDQASKEPLHHGAIVVSRKKGNHHGLMTWDSGPGYVVPKGPLLIKIGSEWLTASSESCILAGDKNSSVTELGDIDFARYLS
jgi:hypothetical protein